MRSHSHDVDDGRELRPKADRIEPEDTSLMYRAAAAGRTDVLGPAGLLGLQRAVGNAGVAGMVEEDRSPVLDVVGSGGGAPLDRDTRTDMESRLGHDFGDVRVHTDSRAHESATAVNAHAYTVGSNIVFQRDRYDPGSTDGRTMLAHELTHVVQQRSGPVEGTPAGGGIQVSDPSDRFEREAVSTAERAMSAPVAVTPSGPAVQREADEEEQPEEAAVQGTFVQRAEGEEVEEEAPT
ncbi:MAG: eCIS core domain-containing protein [Pseudonocardiales bacterium]